MLEKGRSREEEEEEEKQGDGGHQIEDADTLKIRCSKVRTNKRLLKTQFCFKLYKLPSLAWHPKEAARLLENGRNREKEEEEKQGDGGHRTEDADNLKICCSKVQANKQTSEFSNFASNSTSYHH